MFEKKCENAWLKLLMVVVGVPALLVLFICGLVFSMGGGLNGVFELLFILAIPFLIYKAVSEYRENKRKKEQESKRSSS